MLDRLRGRFGTLRWKLTASYVLVTVLVILTLEMIVFVIAGGMLADNSLVPNMPRPSLSTIVGGFLVTLLISAILILVVSGLIGLIFGSLAGQSFSRRLHRLAAASAAVASGDLSQRVEDDSPDEVGELARQFNIMAEALSVSMRSLRRLAERNAQLAEQAAQLATVEERNRLARDLHDSVSQELFSLTLLAAAAKHQLQTDPQSVASELDEIQATAQHALQETRSLIFALRPAMLDDRGLGPALRDLAAAARDRQGLKVELGIEGERRLPLEHEQALFRIVQEALGNIARHSGAREADVRLSYRAAHVRLEVRDRGRGFDPKAPRNPRSLGLTSISERAIALRGRARIESVPGRGTLVSVTLPAPPAR